MLAARIARATPYRERMKLAGLLVAVAACSSGRAAPPAPSTHAQAMAACPRVVHPYLFTVEKDGHRSYLLGTHHVGVSLDRMPRAVRHALRTAKLAVFETDPAEPDAGMPPRQVASLAFELGPALWGRYRALGGDDLADAMEHQVPAVAMVMLQARVEDPLSLLDHDLEQLAQHAHVPTRGLETHAFQTQLMETMFDLRALRAVLATTPDLDKVRDEALADLRAYCAGDRMDRSTRDEEEMRAAGYTQAEVDAYDERGLYSRTRAWVPQLEPIFDRGDAFVAVGLAHLQGDRGLLALLAKDGYTVTRVP
jgi:uncharacterized protein YbaP (TraB family)